MQKKNGAFFPLSPLDLSYFLGGKNCRWVNRLEKKITPENCGEEKKTRKRVIRTQIRSKFRKSDSSSTHTFGGRNIWVGRPPEFFPMDF